MAQTQVSIRVNDIKVDQTFALPFELEQPKKSGRDVVKLGLILFCLSTCLAVNAITVGLISTQWQTSGITIACSILFILLSLLAMYGEDGNSKIEKQLLVGCIGLAIVGIGAIIVGIIFNVESWHDVRRFCNTCFHTDDISTIVNTSTPYYVITFDNSSEYSEIVNTSAENDSIITSVDDFYVSSFPSNDVNLTISISDTLVPSVAPYDNFANITSYNSTEHTEHAAICDRLCLHGRTNLFLILIGLLVCNSLLSLGLSFVIFTTRFRNPDYIAAVSL